MPIINHTRYTDESDLEAIITQADGSPLYGEIEMFKRIFADCNNSEYSWHFWHNLRLPVSIKNQTEIQIDFLLVCEAGVVIVEVKGGKVGIEQGFFTMRFLEKESLWIDLLLIKPLIICMPLLTIR